MNAPLSLTGTDLTSATGAMGIVSFSQVTPHVLSAMRHFVMGEDRLEKGIK